MNTMENSMKIPQSTQILPHNSVIPLLGIYPKEMKSGSQRYIYTLCSLQCYSQKPRCAITIQLKVS